MNVYTAEEELTAPIFARAFAVGCGGRVLRDYISGPWAGFGSPQTWGGLQEAIAQGMTWYYGDHAYFNRHTFYRITKNAYQHTGQGKPDMDRLIRNHHAPRPYRKSGSYILVCPQSQSHFDRFNDPQWLDRTLDIVHRHTDREVIVRWKKDKTVTMDKLLHRAFAVVCHSSNAAVHALMNGVPAFTTAPCAASIMTKSNLEEIEWPIYPDGRDEWAGVLAANQFTLEEIRTGKAWRAIR